MHPQFTPPLTPESIRFWSKVNFNGPLWQNTHCWLWTACLAQGYGKVGWQGRKLYAHRLAYEMLHEALPKETILDHLCRRPACVNPQHLEPVSQRINVLRGESPFAKNARKTHCLRGHSLQGVNVYLPPPPRNNQRHCRECGRIRDRKYYREQQ